MVKIEYVGMFGNNLFTYTYSRILAEKFGIALVSDLPADGYIHNTENKKGLIYNTPPIYVDDRDNPDFKSPSLLEKRTYYVVGFFQNLEYYTDREYIKTFFELQALKTLELLSLENLFLQWFGECPAEEWLGLALLPFQRHLVSFLS